MSPFRNTLSLIAILLAHEKMSTYHIGSVSRYITGPDGVSVR